MNKTKAIVRVALCVAMLIGGQLALSAVSGIEIVTVLLLCFSYVYGIRDGIAIATVFSILRCVIFGFYINVILLYLIYYNLFALFFGWLGKRFSGKISLTKTIIAVASAMLFTVMFTLLDDIITPLLFGFNKNAAITYFFASLYSVIPQVLCAMVTVSVFFAPLTKVLSKIKF